MEDKSSICCQRISSFNITAIKKIFFLTFLEYIVNGMKNKRQKPDHLGISEQNNNSVKHNLVIKPVDWCWSEVQQKC